MGLKNSSAILKYFLPTLHTFSSPERLGLICNEPVALDAAENTNFFIS